MRFVQHVVDFLFVDLEVAAVNSVFLSPEAGLLFNQLIKKSDRAWYHAFIFTGLNDCLWNAFIILCILIALHRKSFPGTGLTISKDSCVESIDDLFYEVLDTTVSENLALACLMVKNDIEPRILVGLSSIVVRATSKLHKFKF